MSPVEPDLIWRVSLPSDWQYLSPWLDNSQDLERYAVDFLLHCGADDRQAAEIWVSDLLTQARDKGILHTIFAPTTGKSGSISLLAITVHWLNTLGKDVSAQGIRRSAGNRRTTSLETSRGKHVFWVVEGEDEGDHTQPNPVQAVIVLQSSPWALVVSGTATTFEGLEAVRPVVIQIARSFVIEESEK
ncbi:hypothetical protein [Corynebacterium cystitidis]|uniref:hypothetical protein n=1 Tax=Corynebacterium cystitidis TaxID=35757 RepID=UPI00211DC40D|nr:hypothetical protein [Corynebacterium cystitidis]